MTKKLYAAIRHERKGMQSVEECCDSLSSATFATRKEAEGWACKRIKSDLAELGIVLDDDEFEKIKERQRKFDANSDDDPAIGCPAPVEVLLLPLDGFDIGAVETAEDTCYYYKIQETIVDLPETAN